MDQEKINDISFDLPKNKSNVIKVIGVGGGGKRIKEAIEENKEIFNQLNKEARTQEL